MKIVIADDHALFVEGLKNLIESRGYRVVGIAQNGLEAFALAKEMKPDVVLLDIFMPVCDGLEATMLINTNFPSIKIVILTSSESEQDVFDAIKFGACGYFIKSFMSNQLFELLEALERNETPVSPGIAGRILKEFSERGDCESGREQMELTRRQCEVLTLVAKGFVYKEIAQNLGISERTVKYHIQSAIDKLHLQNRAQLISYASRNGLLD
jgi:two-component system NarL family response regulator